MILALGKATFLRRSKGLSILFNFCMDSENPYIFDPCRAAPLINYYENRVLDKYAKSQLY